MTSSRLISNAVYAVIRRMIPAYAREWLSNNAFFTRCIGRFYIVVGRPRKKAETSKAAPRRMAEEFFPRYCTGRGLDIGFGGDLLSDNCTGWDFEHGDAQVLNGVEDGEYDFVYSSHTLEHIVQPDLALKNWWRAVKPGGYLILYVPDRDLYEKKRTLPSRWNPDHKHYFLLETDSPPCTLGLLPLVKQNLSDATIIYAKVCSEGNTITDPERHSDGEYSIEIVIRKNENKKQYH